MSPAADNEEIAHLWALRDATRRRRLVLEEQAASYGVGVPSHITIDLAQARKDEELIEAKLQTIEPSPKVAAQIGVAGRITILEHKHTMQGERVDSALLQFREQLTIIRDESREYRAAERQAREERQHAVDGTLLALDRRLRLALIFGGAALLIIAAAVLGLALAVVWYVAHR